jgi:peroxiredoxin
MSTRPAIKAGAQTPEFSLPSTPDQVVSIDEFRGRPVILAFYPADWSPVCGDQMALYNDVLGEFKRFDAELIGISVDGIWCHLAFARAKAGLSPARRFRAQRSCRASIRRVPRT